MSGRVTAVRPAWAIEGGRITIEGTGFPVDRPRLPGVRIGGVPARLVYASPTAIGVVVPAGLEGGRMPITVEDTDGVAPFVSVAAPFATGLHQVDNPVFDRHGNLYVTYSGTRGQQVPVSIFRVHRNGMRETFSSGIVNPKDIEAGNYVASSKVANARIEQAGVGMVSDSTTMGWLQRMFLSVLTF